MVYVRVGLSLTSRQKEVVKKAFVSKRAVVLFLSPSQLSGPDILGLTRAQQKRITAARRKRVGIELRLSKAQVAKQGGFLGSLFKLALPILKSVLPKLGIAAALGGASAAGSTLTKKAIGGKGLLLGKNSPFKNIPLLNILL